MHAEAENSISTSLYMLINNHILVQLYTLTDLLPGRYTQLLNLNTDLWNYYICVIDVYAVHTIYFLDI